MRIAITGASGFVGRQLVPLLESAGHSLLLLGREESRLSQLYPDARVGVYDAFKQDDVGYDLLIHLAVLNNDSNAGLEEFRQVNVAMFSRVLKMAREMNVRRVINVSSFHALDSNNLGPYAQSKREALSIAKCVKNLDVTNLYLPNVYGTRFSGKLSVLNRLPPFISCMLFAVLSALVPVVSVRRIANFISDKAADKELETDVFLADPKLENRFFLTIKRCVDLVFAFAVFGLLWWLLIAGWIAVKISSSGPGVFAQTRVGQQGGLFTCYKFRTMKTGTAERATHTISRGSVTKVGAFLRRTKIDELPQAWNVLKGDMSLIGPRPCLPIQQELIDARNQKGVLQMRPGISGLSQVNGIDMSKPEKLADWDSRYMAEQSIFTDLKIMLSTLTGKGQGDRVS